MRIWHILALVAVIAVACRWPVVFADFYGILCVLYVVLPENKVVHRLCEAVVVVALIVMLLGIIA